MEELFGASLISHAGPVSISVLQGVKYVLVYFSAAWCKPCAGFTPILDMFYESINSFDKDIEVVYVSRDHTDVEFLQNYEKMTWLAVDFTDAPRREMLKERFGAVGIPSLFLVNSLGQVKKSDCVADIKNKGPLCISEWESALANI